MNPNQSEAPDPNKIGKAVEKILKIVPATGIRGPSVAAQVFYSPREGIDKLVEFFKNNLAKQSTVFSTYFTMARMCNDRTTGVGVVMQLAVLMKHFGLPKGGDKQRHSDALKKLESAVTAIHEYNSTLKEKDQSIYLDALCGVNGYALGLLESEVGPVEQESKNT